MTHLRSWSVALVVLSATQAQTKPAYLQEILKQEILPPEVAQYQLRQYILKRIARLEAPSSLAQWNGESKRLREQILSDVVFHGWPKDWVDSPPKFEDLGVIPGNGYQMRK